MARWLTDTVRLWVRDLLSSYNTRYAAERLFSQMHHTIVKYSLHTEPLTQNQSILGVFNDVTADEVIQ